MAEVTLFRAQFEQRSELHTSGVSSHELRLFTALENWHTYFHNFGFSAITAPLRMSIRFQASTWNPLGRSPLHEFRNFTPYSTRVDTDNSLGKHRSSVQTTSSYRIFSSLRTVSSNRSVNRLVISYAYRIPLPFRTFAFIVWIFLAFSSQVRKWLGFAPFMILKSFLSDISTNKWDIWILTRVIISRACMYLKCIVTFGLLSLSSSYSRFYPSPSTPFFVPYSSLHNYIYVTCLVYHTDVNMLSTVVFLFTLCLVSVSFRHYRPPSSPLNNP